MSNTSPILITSQHFSVNCH